MDSRNLVAIFLLLLFFVIPIHFFILGNDYGYGIQGFTYRYQVTNQGISLIPISYELGYVNNQTVTGKTATSIIFWIFGTITYTLGILLYLISYDQMQEKIYQICGCLIFCSLLFFILSCIFQYGIFFVGPSGISILFGAPVLFFVAWLIFIMPQTMLRN